MSLFVQSVLETVRASAILAGLGFALWFIGKAGMKLLGRFCR